MMWENAAECDWLFGDNVDETSDQMKDIEFAKYGLYFFRNCQHDVPIDDGQLSNEPQVQCPCSGPVTNINGVGKTIDQVMKGLKIYTIRDLAHAFDNCEKVLDYCDDLYVRHNRAYYNIIMRCANAALLVMRKCPQHRSECDSIVALRQHAFESFNT